MNVPCILPAKKAPPQLKLTVLAPPERPFAPTVRADFVSILLTLLISTITSNISFIDLFSLLSGYPASSSLTLLFFAAKWQDACWQCPCVWVKIYVFEGTFGSGFNIFSLGNNIALLWVNFLKWSPDAFVTVLALQLTCWRTRHANSIHANLYRCWQLADVKSFPLSCMHLFWIHPGEDGCLSWPMDMVCRWSLSIILKACRGNFQHIRCKAAFTIHCLL